MAVKRRAQTLTGHWQRWFRNREWETMFIHELSRDEKEAHFRISRDRHEVTVYFDLTGENKHHCTCRFFSSARKATPSEGWCFHLAASALRCGREELVLPLLLSTGR